MRLPGVQSVDLQLALVKECYEDEQIHTLALVRTGMVRSGHRGVFDIKRLFLTDNKPRKSHLNNIDLHSCLYHLVQTARFRAKDYL